MNISFSPNYLWPIPFFFLAAGIAIDRYRKRRRGLRARVASPSGSAEGAAVAPAHSRPLATLVGGLLAFVAALDLVFFSVAPLPGKVVDKADGAPIAGALVKRRLYRVGGWRLGDGPSEQAVRGGRVEARTGPDGSFELPGWVSLWPSGLQGLCGMGWMVYEPAHMPAYGCLREGLHAWGASWLGCGAFNMPMDPDPWVRWEWRRDGGRKELVVHTAVKREPEAWAEAFGRASRLLDGHWIELSGYVAEAVGYAGTHEIDEETAQRFYFIAFGLGGYAPHREDFVRFGVAEGRALIKIAADYCRLHPLSETCRRHGRGIEGTQKYLEELEVRP
jgi:hypothetical protein